MCDSIRYLLATKVAATAAAAAAAEPHLSSVPKVTCGAQMQHTAQAAAYS
jgi:hypothetical protein